MSKIFYAGPNILFFDTCPKDYCLSERFYTVKNNFGCIEHESIAMSFNTIESVQDFLIKLDMKPCMYLVEISIFSLNHIVVRLTKIMNNLLRHLKIGTFKVIFLS